MKKAPASFPAQRPHKRHYTVITLALHAMQQAAAPCAASLLLAALVAWRVCR